MIDISFEQKDLELFLLILVRMASFIFISPFFGQANTPQRVKLGFSIFLAMIIYSLSDTVMPEYETVIELAVILVFESVAGLLIGFAAYICSTIIILSGSIIDLEIGLSMASTFDPTTKQQMSITAQYYNYMILLMMIVTRMHIFLLSAIVDSYEIIPVGGIKFNHKLLETFINFISDYFIIGFRIALPVFAVLLLVNSVLGILAKVAPQVNMFAVGIQLKLLVGLIIIFFTVSLIPSIANFIFNKMQSMVIEIIGGLS